MVWKFQGRFESKVDTKGRWTLPAALKGSDSEGSPLIFTVSKNHGLNHLDVYDSVEWAQLNKKVGALASFHAEVQAFKRFYLSSGIEVQPDKLGRYLIPKALRTHAKIESSVVVVGMGEKIEVWSQAHWDKAFQELTETSESYMASLAKLSHEVSVGKKKGD